MFSFDIVSSSLQRDGSRGPFQGLSPMLEKYHQHIELISDWPINFWNKKTKNFVMIWVLLNSGAKYWSDLRPARALLEPVTCVMLLVRCLFLKHRPSKLTGKDHCFLPTMTSHVTSPTSTRFKCWSILNETKPPGHGNEGDSFVQTMNCAPAPWPFS